jgi:hypothetical protein
MKVGGPFLDYFLVNLCKTSTNLDVCDENILDFLERFGS